MFRWILPASLAGLFALIVALPLGWIAPFFIPSDVKSVAPDLKFSGTVWRGQVAGIPVFEEAGFDLVPTARRANIRAGNSQVFVAGQFGLSSASNAQIKVDLRRVPFTDGRLQGLKGDFTASLKSLTFKKDGCVSADGFARTDVLQRNGGTIQWTGPELSGPITCENGSVIADLTGADVQQNISARIRLSPDGAYRADIVARTNRSEASTVLPLFGFSRVGNEFKLTEQGRWR